MLIKVSGQQCEMVLKSKLVSGTTTPRFAEFVFSEDWANKDMLIIFRTNRGIERSAEIADNKCRIPLAVLAAPGLLQAGIIGLCAGRRLPTIWSNSVPIEQGAFSKLGGYSQSFLEATLASARKSAQDAAEALKRCEALASKNNFGGAIRFEVDKTLIFEDGFLRVNTTNQVENDNTLPITSAGVHTVVGNINALLETI